MVYTNYCKPRVSQVDVVPSVAMRCLLFIIYLTPSGFLAKTQSVQFLFMLNINNTLFMFVICEECF